MPPFRPANLNKRAYPGNASVIGPTCTATLGITTTTCFTCISTLCGVSTENAPDLGCRCTTTGCPCCPCCCCCSCTVCDRTVPSGRYKASEQYEARTRDAWGDDSCSTGGQIGFCGSSGTIPGDPVDCKAFYLGNSLWVSPFCTEAASSNNTGTEVSCAQNVMAYNTGWFKASCATWVNCAYPSRSYFDNYCLCRYSTSNSPDITSAFWVDMLDGSCGTTGGPNNRTQAWCGRAFRKTNDVAQ